MVYAQHTIFSLLTIAIVSTNLANHNNRPVKDMKIPPFYTSENSQKSIDESTEESSQENSEGKKQSLTFSEKEITEMELAFENAPKKAKCILNHLEDPTYFPLNENYRSAIFVGEPGTGKTCAAQYIVYKMAQKGWNHTFILSPELLKEYRNGTARKLKKELKASIASGKPTIVVIDELHQLLENSESKHHDSGATASAFWTFLDAQKDNKNFFLIGTMNRADKLPKPYKSRVLFNYIAFPTITDPHLQSKTFRIIFQNNNIIIDSDISDEFLTQEFKKMGSCGGRDLYNLAAEVCKITKIDNPTASGSMVIKKTSILEAMNDFINAKIALRYDSKDETDEERQERHHQENINLQKSYHDEQRLLHKEDQEKQELQFLQQLYIQLNKEGYGSRCFLQFFEEHHEEDDEEEYEENKKKFQKKIANMYAMREFIAKEKTAQEATAKKPSHR